MLLEQRVLQDAPHANFPQRLDCLCLVWVRLLELPAKLLKTGEQLVVRPEYATNGLFKTGPSIASLLLEIRQPKVEISEKLLYLLPRSVRVH